MSEHAVEHAVDEFQHDIGSSGKLGETFAVLGMVILLGGIALWGLGVEGALSGGPTGQGANTDAITIGVFFVVEGVGFMIFGAVAILSGWDRHHDHED